MTCLLKTPVFLTRRVSFFKVFLFLAAGIIFADKGTGVLVLSKYLGFINISIFISLFIFLFSKNNILKNIFIIISLFLTGVLLTVLHDERNEPQHFSKIPSGENSFFTCKIKDIVNKKNKSSLIVEVLSCNKDSDIASRCNGYLKITVETLENLNKGDVISIPGRYFKIPPPENPKSFDAAKYYHYKNIHYQSYLRKNDIKLIKKAGITFYAGHFTKMAKKLKTDIRNMIPNDTTAEIAISIMLGDKRGLDREILQTFSNTGARHILTVSGMHVGIVALILNFIFGLLFKARQLAFIKTTLILAGIWYYAFLTGAGPAVLRAAFMISLFIIAFDLRKYINMFNLLFASATAIIIWNPYQLFNLGFILSYTAILSIMLFYKPVYSVFGNIKIAPVRYLWQLISLSVAAQILISPLVAFYFHNIPVLFFLTAVITTPLAFLTIMLGYLSVLLYSLWHQAGFILAAPLAIIIELSLKFIKYINGISPGIAKYVYLQPVDLLLIFLFVAAVLVLMHTKSPKWKFLAFAPLLALAFNQFVRLHNSANTNTLVIYSNAKCDLFDIYNNGKCYTFDSDCKPEQIRFCAGNYRLSRGITGLIKMKDTFYKPEILKYKNIILTRDKTLVYVKSHDDLMPVDKRNIDFLIISNNMKIPDKILDTINVKNIVLTKRNNKKTVLYWKNIMQKYKLNIWNIYEQGALLINLN